MYLPYCGVMVTFVVNSSVPTYCAAVRVRLQLANLCPFKPKWLTRYSFPRKRLRRFVFELGARAGRADRQTDRHDP